ncbi:MAG: hypothetical protein WA690_12660 [Candidatus Acidiferrales bacterium]
MDESVNKDGEWALNRLCDAHDIHVPLCPALLGEFNDAKYKYRHEITRQYMLASGAFLIENPAKAGDVAAMNLAAVESVLKSSSRSRTRSGKRWTTCSRSRARASWTSLCASSVGEVG